MRNLHKLFYKDYYKDVGFKIETKNEESIVISDKSPHNRELLDAKLWFIPKIETVTEKETFTLITQYPGLITGVGIDHEAGIEGEFKLGLHFDYTYGMPVIYGSSVKGVLKTYFEDFAKDRFIEYFKQKGFSETQTKDFLKELLYDVFDGEIMVLEKGKEGKMEKKKKKKPIFDRDTFFDAVIKKPNQKGKILDSDTLCPHGNNPLKSPKPITFLKIASGVTIEFRFKLVVSTIGDKKVTQDDKINIFREILKTVGIGAKTNVGYGQFK